MFSQTHPSQISNLSDFGFILWYLSPQFQELSRLTGSVNHVAAAGIYKVMQIQVAALC